MSIFNCKEEADRASLLWLHPPRYLFYLNPITRSKLRAGWEGNDFSKKSTCPREQRHHVSGHWQRRWSLGTESKFITHCAFWYIISALWSSAYPAVKWWGHLWSARFLPASIDIQRFLLSLKCINSTFIELFIGSVRFPKDTVANKTDA